MRALQSYVRDHNRCLPDHSGRTCWNVTSQIPRVARIGVTARSWNIELVGRCSRCKNWRNQNQNQIHLLACVHVARIGETKTKTKTYPNPHSNQIQIKSKLNQNQIRIKSESNQNQIRIKLESNQNQIKILFHIGGSFSVSQYTSLSLIFF